jgi:hypothetical protein
MNIALPGPSRPTFSCRSKAKGTTEQAKDRPRRASISQVTGSLAASAQRRATTRRWQRVSLAWWRFPDVLLSAAEIPGQRRAHLPSVLADTTYSHFVICAAPSLRTAASPTSPCRRSASFSSPTVERQGGLTGLDDIRGSRLDRIWAAILMDSRVSLDGIPCVPPGLCLFTFPTLAHSGFHESLVSGPSTLTNWRKYSMISIRLSRASFSASSQSLFSAPGCRHSRRHHL